MKVALVCYEDPEAWILGKFARRMEEELKKNGVDVYITRKPDPEADINHHIIYVDYDGKSTGLDTLMITHVDSAQKIKKLKKQLEIARVGICMSQDTMMQLVETGIPKDRLCYISPAHDGIIKPAPLTIGITSKTHSDGRKKEKTLLKLAGAVTPNDFAFKIMGSGWDVIVEELKTKGFTVEYWPQFDYGIYLKLMPTLDYFLYMSWDEGSMGFIDALAAGIKTVVTPQGFHLDVPRGITHSINTPDDIIKTFRAIAEERRKRVNSIADWTWKNYSLKHLEVWEFLLNQRKATDLRTDIPLHTDGLPSLTQTYTSNQMSKLKHTVKSLAQPLTWKQFVWDAAPKPVKIWVKKRLVSPKK